MYHVTNAYLQQPAKTSYIHTTPQEKLEAECGLRPTEVVVGGSIGHRTALPWKFDADIVIYSEGGLLCNIPVSLHLHDVIE